MRDESEAKVLKDVAEYGWHMINVAEDDQGPGFTYSIGLFKSFGHPELVVFGLPPAVMPRILATATALIKDGYVFKDGGRTDAILEGYECVFRSVSVEHYNTYLGYAMWFYRIEGATGFPALQLLWPDKSGKFPWEADFFEGNRGLQPLLFEPRLEASHE